MKEGNWKAFNASSLGALKLLSLRVYKLIYPYLTTYQIAQLMQRSTTLQIISGIQ